MDSCISHDEFVLAINVLQDNNEMKEKTKNLKTPVEYTI